MFGFDFDDDRYSWSSDNSSDGGFEVEHIQRERIDAQFVHQKRCILYQVHISDGRHYTPHFLTMCPTLLVHLSTTMVA